MTVPAVSVLGYSNTGKTTFVTALVAAASAQGLRIATIKYSHHPGDFERPGSDTDLARHGGAVVTAYRSDDTWFVTAPGEKASTQPRAGDTRATPVEADLPAWIVRAAGDIDLVISEGRLIANSIVVLAAGSAVSGDEMKYDPKVADIVLGSPALAEALDGTVPVLSGDAAVSVVIERIKNEGAPHGGKEKRQTELRKRQGA